MARFARARGGGRQIQAGRSLGRSVGVKVDTSHLKKLRMGLRDLSASQKEEVIGSAIKASLPGAAKEARTQVAEIGGFKYGRKGQEAKAKRGIKGKYHGNGQGEIKAVHAWPNIKHWASPIKPRGDYTKSGAHGVQITGVYNSNFRIAHSKGGFVRAGGSGNVMVFQRTGASRFPLSAYYGPNAAQIMVREKAAIPIIKKFNARLVVLYRSKYRYRLGQVKARYGL